jgi:hypothetical protein
VDYQLIIKIALIVAAILLAAPVDYRLIIIVVILTILAGMLDPDQPGDSGLSLS